MHAPSGESAGDRQERLARVPLAVEVYRGWLRLIRDMMDEALDESWLAYPAAPLPERAAGHLSREGEQLRRE